MEPQQPAPYTPPDNPYGFIMEPPKKPKQPKIKLGVVSKNPFLMRLVMIIGGAVVLMIAAAVLINIFFGDKTNTTGIVAITQTENEIIRVSENGSRAVDGTIQNAAITTRLTVITQQQAWMNFLANHGRKVSPKELTLKKNAGTDEQLTQAQATSTFDIVLTQTLKSQLESYATALKDAYNNANNNQQKNLLSDHYDQVQLLLQQFPKSLSQ